jgi:hypothetical protein
MSAGRSEVRRSDQSAASVNSHLSENKFINFLFYYKMCI